ncbi:MAG TPA: ABC transporter permease [Longimicrobiales bacterium]|nr:ABC transporter permease [Longimicrobiales bacterium]
MSWLRGVRARLSSLLRRRVAETRMDEEIAFHIERQTEKNIRQGMAPSEARRRALLQFGGVDRHREELRDVRRPRLLAELRQDAGYTVRSLRAAPSFAVTAVVVIALGVGATTALFSLASALLLRPLPVASPDELYMLQEIRSAGTSSSGPEGQRIPYARYEAYREGTRDMAQDLAAHALRTFALRTEAGAQPVPGAVTSGNYFEVLGLRPALGRYYATGDEPVAVLSHRFWRTHFNEDAGVIGRVVHLDGHAYTVVGVAARPFDGSSVGLLTSVWVPFEALRAMDPSVADQRVGMIARVPGNAPDPGTGARLTALARQIPAESPAVTIERAYFTRLTGLPDGARGGVMGFMGMLLAAAFLVLLIAAANIAALLLARAVVRQREMGLRMALGAGRARLVRQLLTESMTLFLAGGVGGILLAYLATAYFARIRIPGLPIAIEAAPDLRVLAFALGVAALTGIMFGLAPALRATRTDVARALRDGGARGSTAQARGRSIFVAAQLAFATVLLICAGLFVRGLQHGLSQDPGFHANGVVVGSVDLEPQRMDEAAARSFQAELKARVSALPGVESAAWASTVLGSGNHTTTRVQTTAAEPEAASVTMNIVDEGYLETLRIPLLRGRGFRAADDGSATPVVIVNERLAERFWPGVDALGQQIERGGRVYEVIGVTPNGRYVELNEEPHSFILFAAAQEFSPQMSLHVRGRDDAALIHGMRQELQAMNPDVALEFAMPLTRMMGLPLIPQRFAASLIGAFGVLGLLLAGAGVYGMMSYQVAQRRREFGVRIALGATARHLLRLVLGHGAVIAGVGAFVGIALAAGAARLLTSMLFGLRPLDPVTFGGVALTLAVVALLACWAPARRALRVDPVVSLREE